jgi:hypothetical protein
MLHMKKNHTVCFSLEMLFLFGFGNVALWLNFGVGLLLSLDRC